MDTHIRTLLTGAQSHGVEKGGISLQDAYDQLRSVAESHSAVDVPEPFNSDLYVLCAEISFQHGKREMAQGCLKMYFMKTPPSNQFLCRAYLCQAQLLAPTSANNMVQLEKAVVYLLKAINMAKENTRYHFLVYNASVIYWQFCRPFLKSQYRQYLAQSLHQVVKALDDIDDKDYEWRAQLMIALIECHMDAGRKSDASHIATAAASFVRQNVPTLYKTLFGLMIRHQLIDVTNVKIQKDIRSSPELNAFFKLCRLKLAIEQKDAEKDIPQDMRKLLLQLCGTLPDDLPPVKTKERGGRRSTTPEEKRSPSRQPSRAAQRTPTPTGARKLPKNSPEKPYLLLELARLALEQDMPQVAQEAVDHIKEHAHLIKEQSQFLEIEFLASELMVRNLLHKQESYGKAYIDIRLQAIKRCDEAILNAIRSGNPNVIQAGCVTQWNLCLPLLQNKLRHYVRRPLTLVSEALEDIQSLLVELRCQVHQELACCEEEQEQITVAMQHLNKARNLDDGNVYQERIEVLLKRLDLRAELYKQPERMEDQAAMIVEQARKANSGTIRMKRSLLVKAGQALAPDAFSLVLDSENDTKELGSGKGPMTQIRRLAAKAEQFNKCVKKAEGHLRRLGNEDDRERARIWGDLAKTARKQEVWDVCRVACRFCLLYDDDRWKIPLIKESTTKMPRSKSTDRELGEAGELERSGTDLAKTTSRVSKDASRPNSPDHAISAVYNKDLIRMLAEVNFINGEAIIHLLRSEGIELGDAPIPPEDRSKRPKGYIAKKPEEDPEWIEYCQWISALSESAVDCFLRSATLGVQLQEAWIVCSATAYIWNYNNHVFSQSKHNRIVDTLQALLDAMKKVGHAGETVLLVNLCNALATGLLLPWLPPPQPKDAVVPSPPPDGDVSPGGNKSPNKKAGRGAPTTNKSKSAVSVSLSPDATPDLKRAVEVCEYALKITNGDRVLDLVPIAVRHPLLQTWSQAKQMLQSQIGRSLGADDEDDQRGQKPMTRAIVALEILTLNTNGIMEFKDTPSLMKTVELVEKAEWTDNLIQLQLWTRLVYLAHQVQDHQVVASCAQKALEFAEVGTQSSMKKDQHKYMVEQELLSQASSLYGQSLVENTQGKNAVRRHGMQQFLESARFACNARNGEMVMQAARHYWNACLPLIGQPIERELLKEPLTILLQCITDTTDKNKYKRDEEEEEDEEKAGVPGIPAIENTPSADKVTEKQPEAKPSAMGIIGGPDDDLTVRASLYGVLFQAYADMGEWEAGLQAMDQAVADMPRTNHRLLIFKHLVIVKAKLGLSVGMSIQKFKDESEDYVAHMWRRVALCSKQQLEQLQAYQNAIEALNSPSNEWQKFDYLLEFGQWLFCNEFPLQDSIDQIQWAADILLNMKFEVVAKEGKQNKKNKGKKFKTPPASASKTDKKGKKKESKKSQEERKKELVSAETARTDSRVSEGKTKEIDYVPVEREVVIGCLPSNSALTIHDLQDVRQLEGLFRSQVLLAQISGRADNSYGDHCLMAYAYIIRMWQVSLGHCGPVVKEILRNAASEQVPTKGSTKNSTKGKKEKETVTKERPKRKGAVDSVPHNVEEWAAYDTADEVLEAFNQDSMRLTGINSSTVTKPSLTLFYLEWLSEQLRQLGYNQLALPVLAMADVVARQMLKTEPLNNLIHLRCVFGYCLTKPKDSKSLLVRALAVCVELSLPHGVNLHKQLVEYKLNEEEQAKSHKEMTLWKEKQIQVAKEELRIRESLSRIKQNDDAKKAASKEWQIQQKLKEKLFQTSAQANEVSEEEFSSSHLGRQIGAVMYRDVWTDTAEVLLKMAMYQPARDMLNEAFQAAEAFEDVTLTSRILYLLGKLSFYEAQYGQAINLCMQAQRTYDGDEQFWFDTTMLMVDATLADFEMKANERNRKARGLLVHALHVFNDVAVTRPNKKSICGYILAKLVGRLGSVQATICMLEHDNITKPKVVEALFSACKKLERGAIELVDLGYRRDAVTLMRERSDILVRLARESNTSEEKHGYFVQSLDVLWQVVTLAEDIWHDAYSITDVVEMRAMILPVQRELADIQLSCGELMLEMLTLHVSEQRDQQVQHQQKGPVLRLVEDLVRQTPDFTSKEKQWNDAIQIMEERITSLLASAHSLSGNMTDLRARSLCGLGRCLRQLSMHTSPDPPGQWNLTEMAALNISRQLERSTIDEAGEGEEDGEVRSTTDSLNRDSKEYNKSCNLFKKIKGGLLSSHQYLAQATECLTQALNLSLNKSHVKTASIASLELVECTGQFDPGLASQYLALHQSCESSIFLEGLMNKALVDSTQSQQAALLHQYHRLQDENVTSNTSHAPVMTSIMKTLQENSEAWKRLAVLPQHLDILKEFPPNYNFIVLQHSPDQKYLYGGILDKPKASSGGGGGKGAKAATGPQTPSRAKVVRVDTTPEKLSDLRSRWKWYKHQVMQVLLKMEYQTSLLAQREKMLASLEDGSGVATKSTLEEDFAAEEQRLHTEFVQLLSDMEEYLQPVMTQIHHILRPSSATTVSHPRDKSGKDDPPHEVVVLLADPVLLELPLEALQAIHSESITSISRDVSLQMLYHKIHREPLDEAAEKLKKEREKNKPPSRIPGLRDAAKKMSKIIPLDRPLPANCLPVDTHEFRYILDPHLDCSETEKHKPIEFFNNMMVEHEQQFTPRWLGVPGDDHSPSPGEYEIYLTESSAFLFYGMERFMCYVPPHKIAAMNLPNCELVMLYDLSQTNSSYLRQAKIDVLKTADTLYLEKPVETALLLSLTGINCVCLNQWHSTLSENSHKLDHTMRDLLAKGKTTGEMMRYQYFPQRRKEEEDALAAAAEEAKNQGQSNNNVGSKGQSQDKLNEKGLGSNGDEGDGDKDVDEEEEKEPEFVMNRSWYNMVCYGLPNLMVTQLSK